MSARESPYQLFRIPVAITPLISIFEVVLIAINIF